jgi:hypothetical protein
MDTRAELEKKLTDLVHKTGIELLDKIKAGMLRSNTEVDNLSITEVKAKLAQGVHTDVVVSLFVNLIAHFPLALPMAMEIVVEDMRNHGELSKRVGQNLGDMLDSRKDEGKPSIESIIDDIMKGGKDDNK